MLVKIHQLQLKSRATGFDDQIGAAGNSRVVRRAVDLVRVGRFYTLGVEDTPQLRMAEVVRSFTLWCAATTRLCG